LPVRIDKKNLFHDIENNKLAESDRKEYGHASSKHECDPQSVDNCRILVVNLVLWACIDVNILERVLGLCIFRVSSAACATTVSNSEI
jgi:hypothetical protein